MAVVFNPLTVDENLLGLADKPILASTPDPDFLTAGWDVGTITGTIASATDNDADKPARRVWDGLPGLTTSPSITGTLFTLVMEHTAGIEFDFFGFLNHNLASIGISDVTLQIADDTTFSTNLRTLSSFDPATGLAGVDRRFQDLTLFHTGSAPIRYSQVQYIRIQITAPGAVTPSIGQVVFGRRRQLRYEPNRPWDPTDLISSLDSFESRAGVISTVPRFRGRRKISADLNPDVEGDKQNLIDWFTQTNEGALPFVWIDKPTTDPIDFWFMRQPAPTFEFPFVSPFTREFTLQGIEQGPTFFSQDPIL